MAKDVLGLRVCLYRVGRNFNVAYRTCEFFGIKEMLTCECTGKLSGNLYKAKDRVVITEIAEMPTGDGVIYLETTGTKELAEVEWGMVHTICIGGETYDFRGAKFKDVQKYRISGTGMVSGLTVEAALAIALREASGARA